ncbi:hypothetical protein TNCV_378851 [Trichonephila clavipes]|nr:hypothetical protein TNCV_378851 [Trichonephila clavipes]
MDGYEWAKSGLPVIESIPNKWYCHQEGRQRASKFAQDRYLALSARQHRWKRCLNFLVTFLLCLGEEFPGKKSTVALQRLAFTPGV